MRGWISLFMHRIDRRHHFPDYLVFIHVIEKNEFLTDLLGCNRAFS